MIMDGHGSHFTLELLKYCRMVGLHIVLRPPHTTHILQGEDVVHFQVFKGKYHQAKLVALAQKVFQHGAYRLSAADLLKVAKAPWEEAFNFENTIKAWSKIGIHPFDQRVYWDLKKKEETTAEVAKMNEINPHLLTVKGMVGIMFNVDGAADAPPEAGPPQKRKRDNLNSSDLWDLPGGATGDECFELVKTKVEAREEKAKRTAEKKLAAAQKKTDGKAALLSSGAGLVAVLTDKAHIFKLTVAQLQAALTFKAVAIPKGALKGELQSLLVSDLSLPALPKPPPLSLPAPPALHEAAGPSTASGSTSGNNPPDEDESSDESGEDDM